MAKSLWYLAAAALGSLVTYLAIPPAIAPVSVAVHVPDQVHVTATVPMMDVLGGARITAATAPTPIEARGDRLRPGERLFTSVVRHRVSEQLQRHGFAAVGGNPTPLTREQAAALLARVDDGQIVEAARHSGAVGDGSFLDRLASVLSWLADHKEEILAVVKIILTILALFAGDMPTG